MAWVYTSFTLYMVLQVKQIQQALLCILLVK